MVTSGLADYCVIDVAQRSVALGRVAAAHREALRALDTRSFVIVPLAKLSR